MNHFDESGQAHMVDVGGKPETHRLARASGHITMQRATFDLIKTGGAKKGDVLGIARIAAIQGTKRTPDLIPLAHPLIINRVVVEFVLHDVNAQIECIVVVETFGRTGVEMEALTGVSAGLLTIYDMVKAMDRGMTISGVRLLEKAGGKSGDFKAGE